MRKAEGTTGNGSGTDRTAGPEPVDISTFMKGFMADLSGYATAQKRYLVLKASHKMAVVMGKVVHRSALLAGLALASVFLGVALALYLGELLLSYPLGFLLTALLVLVLLGTFSLWWTKGGRDRFILARINDMNDEDDL
jgi:hypothetical protein